MPERVFFGYLAVSLLILVAALVRAGARRAEVDSPSERAVVDSLLAACGVLVAAFGLLVPLFYLLYIGALAGWSHGPLARAVYLVLPLAWALLSVDAWATGRRFWERYGTGLTYVLTVPVLFAGVWFGRWIGGRYLIVFADGALLLAGVALWWRARRRCDGTPGGPASPGTRSGKAPATTNHPTP